MLEKISGLFRLLWDSGRLLSSHSEAIKSSEETGVKVLHLIQLISSQNRSLEQQLTNEREARKVEMEHERELRRKDLENLELRLRLEISEKLRQLPPGER